MKLPNENKLGYKETKVGWIPKDWEFKLIDEVTTRATGHTPDQNIPEYWNGNIQWVSLADSRRLDSLEITRTEKQITQAGIKNSSAKLLPKGTVIMLRDAAVGRVSIIGEEMAVSQHFVAWICSKESNNKFLYYWMLSQRKQLERIAVGTTIVTIGMPFFRKLGFPLPPIGEQKNIATILSTCDTAIDLTRDLITAKKKQKKALMQQLLTGKKRLHGFRDKWVIRSIRNMYYSVSRPAPWDDDKVYSLLSVRRRSGGVFLREHLQGSKILTKTLFTAHAGDFLISKMQVLHGATALVPQALDGCHISGSYIALRPSGKEPIDPVFFTCFSDSPEFRHLTYLCSYGVHIEKMTFNLSWFLDSKILIPPTIVEQQAIAEVLLTADAEIRLLEEKQASLQLLKKGLMQKLLTGEIRVKS